MTKSEAIEQLKKCKSIHNGSYGEPINMAIEALKREPCEDTISRQAAIDAVKSRKTAEQCEKGVVRNWAVDLCVDVLEKLPSAQSEWNNHTVACLLAELFDDTCACNYNGIDEWLPEKCEVIDSCPHPVGVACWEQFLTHRTER